MQKLTIKKLPDLEDTCDLNTISGLLNTLEKHKLEFVPWTEFPYKPSVLFSIAYNPNTILLKFFVQEKQIRANNQKTNSPIWEDSCVEFFISFDNGDNYYNIEFNCIGTGLIGYGKSKIQRDLLDASLVNQVKTLSNINLEKGKKVKWELTMLIPLSIFSNSALNTLENKKCTANFYKCGDLLPEPHFVAWSNIESENPNFHLPTYFGHLTFE